VIHESNQDALSWSSPRTLSDEIVTYLVIGPKPFVSINTGTGAIEYQIDIQAHTNCVWWPAVAVPALNGIVDKPIVSVSPVTPAQDKFVKIAETHLSNPSPMPMPSWKAITKVLLDGAAKVPFIGTYASGARDLMTSIGILNIDDPASLEEDWTGNIVDLDATILQFQHKWGTFSDPDIEAGYLDMINAMNALVQLFKARMEEVEFIKEKYRSCTAKTSRIGSTMKIRYYDADGEVFDHRVAKKARGTSRETVSIRNK